jgi:hypothetical protein
MYFLENIKNDIQSIKTDQCLMLPTNNKKVFDFLEGAEYLEFVVKIIKRIEIPVVCSDIYLSEIDINMFDLINEIIKDQIEKVKIEKDPSHFCYLIKTKDFFSNFILTLISQFHTEVTATYEYFLKYVEALKNHSGNINNLYLNAKGSTSFSQFIQLWVADKMKMPIYKNNILVV